MIILNTEKKQQRIRAGKDEQVFMSLLWVIFILYLGISSLSRDSFSWADPTLSTPLQRCISQFRWQRGFPNFHSNSKMGIFKSQAIFPFPALAPGSGGEDLGGAAWPSLTPFPGLSWTSWGHPQGKGYFLPHLKLQSS